MIQFIDLKKTGILDNAIVDFDRNQNKKVVEQE